MKKIIFYITIIISTSYSMSALANPPCPYDPQENLESFAYCTTPTYNKGQVLGHPVNSGYMDPHNAELLNSMNTQVVTLPQTYPIVRATSYASNMPAIFPYYYPIMPYAAPNTFWIVVRH